MIKPIELRYGSKIWAWNFGKGVEEAIVRDPACLPNHKDNRDGGKKRGKPQVFEGSFVAHFESAFRIVCKP